MKKAVFTVILFFTLFSTVLTHGQKEVDLSIDKIWPAIKNAVPDNAITDSEYKYYGGYHFIPKHIFKGYPTVGLPVTYSGSEDITFDWQLELIKDPNGSATSVFKNINSHTLSETAVLNFDSDVTYKESGKYRLKSTILSDDDINSVNNIATFDFELSDSTYGFASSENLTSVFKLGDLPSTKNGDGVGIELYFPNPESAANPFIIKSASIKLADQYDGDIDADKVSITTVLYQKTAVSWNPLSQSEKTIKSTDLNKILTFSFSEDIEVNEEGIYRLIARIHQQNNLDDGLKLTLANDSEAQGPSDMRCITIINAEFGKADYAPAIWLNIEPKELPTNTKSEVLAFSLPSQISSRIDATTKSINIKIPISVDITNIAATFSLSSRASATIDEIEQVSGTTTNNFESPVVYSVTAEDGITKTDWIVNVTRISNETEILEFALPNQIESQINSLNKTIEVEMPMGTDLTSLIAQFKLSEGAVAYVESIEQISGTTVNDFSTAITYTVKASDGISEDDWTINVEIETSVETDFLVFTIPSQIKSEINVQNHNISILLPKGTSINSLVATFELSAGATTQVEGLLQESGITANDFTNPVTYMVTAADGVTTQEWKVYVNLMTTSNTHIKSFSIDGQYSEAIFSGTDITVYMPEGTDLTDLVSTFELAEGATVTIDGVNQESGITANDFSSPLVYTVKSYDNIETENWTVTVKIFEPGEGDFISFKIIGEYNSTIDPGKKTIKVQVFDNADITALVAEYELSTGALAYIGSNAQESGVTANDFTNPVIYQINGQSGNVYFWTIEVTTISATETKVFSYEIPNQVNSSIDHINKTIFVNMPEETDVSALIATFTLSPGATAKIDEVAQESGITVNNFEAPVEYTITAADGITKATYVVVINVESSAAEIVSYNFPNQDGDTQIENNNRTIEIKMPIGTDVTSLIATFELSKGATAYVGDEVQISGNTANDFSTQVIYTVKASDGITENNWTVTVTVEPGHADILSYSLPNQVSSSINNELGTINVSVPKDMDITNLVATFELSYGASASIDGVEQISEVTTNNFESHVKYTVTSIDGLKKEWVVTVTEQATPEMTFLTYSINGNEGEIDNLNAIIRVVLPSGSDLSSQIANYTTSQGTIVKVNNVEQESGVTINNFSKIVKYKLTSKSGKSRKWYVIATIDGEANNETAVLYYGFYGQTNPASIDHNTKIISVNLIPSLNQEELIPMFYLSDGAIAFIDEKVQWSGENVHDFTNDVVYNIVAEDGKTSEEWTVRVTSNMSTLTEITQFKFMEVEEDKQHTTIYENTNLIYVDVPTGVNKDSLTAVFELSRNASVTVNGMEQNSGITSNNFTTPLIYTVTAEDNSTTQNWTVIVRNYVGAFEIIEPEVNIYPNPALDYVTITLPEYSTNAVITFLDISGKIVQTQKLNSTTQQIPVHNLEGLYFIHVKTEHNTWTQQLIIN